MHVTSNSAYTLFFERFMEGCHRRMGDKSQADLGFSIEVMMAYQEMLEDEWWASVGKDEKLEIAPIGAFVIVSFCLNLRGEELLMMELHGLCEYFEELGRHRLPHVLTTLLGRFKMETFTRHHLLPGCDQVGVAT